MCVQHGELRARLADFCQVLERLRAGIDPLVPMMYLPFLFTRLHGLRTLRQVAASLGEELTEPELAGDDGAAGARHDV